MAAHNELGKWGEELAVNFLQKKGYNIIERDWHLGKRDVDIIATTEDDMELVFIEVKTRKWDDIIDPEEAVNRQKMKSIGYCANAYIKMMNPHQEIRFDIISIIGDGNNSEVTINHIEDAFNPCRI